MRHISLFVIIGLVLVFLVGGLCNDTLSRLEVSSLRIDGFKASTGGFYLTGEITAKNGGLLDVTLEQIDYVIRLESTGDKLAEGRILGRVLEAGKIIRIPLETELNIDRTPQVILQLLSEDTTYVSVQGYAKIRLLGIISLESPVSLRYDIKEQLYRFYQEEIANAIPGQIGDFLGQIIGG